MEVIEKLEVFFSTLEDLTKTKSESLESFAKKAEEELAYFSSSSSDFEGKLFYLASLYFKNLAIFGKFEKLFASKVADLDREVVRIVYLANVGPKNGFKLLRKLWKRSGSKIDAQKRRFTAACEMVEEVFGNPLAVNRHFFEDVSMLLSFRFERGVFVGPDFLHRQRVEANFHRFLGLYSSSGLQGLTELGALQKDGPGFLAELYQSIRDKVVFVDSEAFSSSGRAGYTSASGKVILLNVSAGVFEPGLSLTQMSYFWSVTLLHEMCHILRIHSNLANGIDPLYHLTPEKFGCEAGEFIEKELFKKVIQANSRDIELIARKLTGLQKSLFVPCEIN